MRRKNNYVMRRLDTPKKVTLSNCRTFYDKYQRVPRSQLPPNVIMKRNIKEEQHQKVEEEGQWERGKEVEVFSVVLKKLIIQQ